MKLGDCYKGYEVIQVCNIEHWGVYLMQNLENRRVFGVLDYSFETDDIYDFDKDLDMYEALDRFIDRIPISINTIDKQSLYSEDEIKMLKSCCLSQIAYNLYGTYHVSERQKQLIENDFDYDEIVGLYIDHNENWHKAIRDYMKFHDIEKI